jgi:uncharacterized protein (DUF2252 family)
VPIRYGRMLISPFAFYRGAAMIMAHDLAATPRSGLTVQSCGDAHLSNFGVFASPERRLIFDLNDFDETLPGPWEWDVKRLAASMTIAAIENGFSVSEQESIVLDTVGAYRNAIRRFAQMTNLDVWYAHIDTERALREFGSQLKPKQLRRAEKDLAKARTRDSMSAFSKLTEMVDGKPRIADQSPLIVPVTKLGTELNAEAVFGSLRELLRSYRSTLEFDRRVLLEQFELVDFARKVVGVGSVGTRVWIALMIGHDDREPLFLQIKLHQSLPGHDPLRMGAYGKLCGATLARAHARSGDRVAIAAYLGSSDTFDQAILDFSKAYAEQNEHDYNELANAVNSTYVPWMACE